MDEVVLRLKRAPLIALDILPPGENGGATTSAISEGFEVRGAS